MAEALVHQHVPLEALDAIVCRTEAIADRVRGMLQTQGSALTVRTESGWYF